MSEATRYTIFFVLSFVTFTAWGMITHDLRGTVWYWAAGVLLAGLSEGLVPGMLKKISEEKAQPLGFFRFGPMMICLNRSLSRLAAALKISKKEKAP